MKKSLIFAIIFILAVSAVFSEQKTAGIADYYDFSADSIQADGTSITASGNVVFKQKDIVIKASGMKFDRNSNILTATGQVDIEYKTDRFKGKRLLYNASLHEAVLYDISGFTQQLSFEEGQMTGKLFFSGRKLFGQPEELNFYNVKTTTCDLPAPHYFIKAKRIIVYPNNKLIIKDASFYFNNKPLFTVPSVVYSLRPRGGAQSFQSVIPKISSNNIDGLTVKETLNYTTGERDYGTIILDYHQNTGMGYGLDQYFDFKDKGDAALHFYKLNSTLSQYSRHEYSARLNYMLPMDMKLNYLFSSNYYQVPSGENYPAKSSSFSLSRSGARSSFVASSSLYNIGFNLNQGYNLYQTYNLSPTLKSFFHFDYSKNRSNAGETYNVHPVLRFYNTGKVFDTQVSYERTGGSLQNGLDREPEVSLISHRMPFGPFDFQATASYGLFREKPAVNRIARSFVELALPYKIWKLTDKSYLDSHTFANKYWYDNGADYRLIGNRTGVFSQFTKYSTARLDFFYQSPLGSAPIELDRVSYYKMLLGSINVFDNKNYNLSAGSSYNLNTKKWQDMICRLSLTPGNFGYLNFGANYDTQTRHWKSLDTQLDIILGKTVNFRYWSEYDIRTRSLITQDYSIIKDFHCWEARLVYRGFSNQWWFDAVIKAFPSEDITIGTNQTKPILPEEGWQRF
ncbi:MAG: hypothetical protein ABIH00_05115 [Armatimonadota bacterium]